MRGRHSSRSGSRALRARVHAQHVVAEAGARPPRPSRPRRKRERGRSPARPGSWPRANWPMSPPFGASGPARNASGPALSKLLGSFRRRRRTSRASLEVATRIWRRTTVSGTVNSARCASSTRRPRARRPARVSGPPAPAAVCTATCSSAAACGRQRPVRGHAPRAPAAAPPGTRSAGPPAHWRRGRPSCCFSRSDR